MSGEKKFVKHTNITKKKTEQT